MKNEKDASYLDIVVILCSIRYMLWHTLSVPLLFIIPLRSLPLEKNILFVK